MRSAIIGSRQRTDQATVAASIAALPDGTVVVSGGCRTPDRWAAEVTRARGLECVEHFPDLAGVRCRDEAARRYRAHNQRFVDDCDRLIAFIAPDCACGTEDAIRQAERARKPVALR
jgi:hypothetical protein